VAVPALRAAAGGAAATAEPSSKPAPDALAPSPFEPLVVTFLDSPTGTALAMLLAAATVPSADDSVGQVMLLALSQIVRKMADGKLGREELTDILKDAGLTTRERGLDKANPKLAKRFMPKAEYEKKERKAIRKKQQFQPKLTFPQWQRAVIIRLLEILASRAAAFVNESSTADADTKWDAKVAAAEASRAALVALEPDDYKIKVLKSLADSAAALQDSGLPYQTPLFALSAEAEVYFPNGRWTKKKEKGVLQKERFDAFKQKLQDYAKRPPAAEELATMVTKKATKDLEMWNSSAATQQRVHAAQLAAGASFPRPRPPWPVDDEAGLARALAEDAVLEAAPRREQACHLGALSRRHNAAIDASIKKSGPLPPRTHLEGQNADHQMFYRTRDVPKPKSPEEIVATYRLSTGWNGSEWTSGGGQGGARPRGRPARARRHGGTGARRGLRPGPLVKRLRGSCVIRQPEGERGCASTPRPGTYRAHAGATIGPKSNRGNAHVVEQGLVPWARGRPRRAAHLSGARIVTGKASTTA